MNEKSVLYRAYLQELASRINDAFSLPKEYLPALIEQESQWNPKAYNKSGAAGLAQIKPDTLSYLKKIGLEIDPYDPEQAMTGAATYLKDMSSRFKQFNNPEHTLLRYNAGPKAGSEMLLGQRPYTQEAKEYPGKVEAIRQRRLKKYSPLELMGLMAKQSAIGNGTIDSLK